MPGWYGCACIKWVDRIDLVPDEAPATTQMREFAARTHQSPGAEIARDFKAAHETTASPPVAPSSPPVAPSPHGPVLGPSDGATEPGTAEPPRP